MPEAYRRGDKVAWTMLDGNLTAGEVRDVGHSLLHIRRVDGSQVIVDKNETSLRQATSEDIAKAVEFFRT